MRVPPVPERNGLGGKNCEGIQSRVPTFLTKGVSPMGSEEQPASVGRRLRTGKIPFPRAGLSLCLKASIVFWKT